MGEDGIPNEVLKYGGERVVNSLKRMCEKVWKGEGWPEGWKEGIVVPVVKKGQEKTVEEYRGVALTQTAYKVYVGILAERLWMEVEGKGMMPRSQAGFREGMGTMDNVYVLNYLINREITERRGKVVLLFVDLKAAFDSVDRAKLVESMRKRVVREGLIERCEEVMKETYARVKVGGGKGDKFWTEKGVRQGCPLSPQLFTLLLAVMDEELEKGRRGGVKLGGGGKVYSLAYADDVVLLAKDEDEMKGMMRTLERYIEGKGLEVNTGKTKVMRCRVGGGRKRKVVWQWGGVRIEEVNRYAYLGYVVRANGSQEEQVEERVMKAAKIMGKVWGIGKNKFGSDWGRRVWLFDKLVWPVVGYGVEIWGWKGREIVERLLERYLRWVLGVSREVAGYMVREELQRDKLKVRSGMRAWGYEKRLETGKGGELARRCRGEMKRRAGRRQEAGGWESERKEFYLRMGWDLEEVERRWQSGDMKRENIVREERVRQEEGRWERIIKSRSNRDYKFVKERGIPRYLKKGWKEERWGRVARFRLGDEMRAYWEQREGRECRMCTSSRETWEHVMEECTGWGAEEGWQSMREEVLGGEGQGEEWMKKIEEWRG
ncbi:uncharacterized protein [Venturia canescens]|uniref:uncharacterized protein n=1 Tax=Venturia canescens TaxID=32260 RepID=UPI001C9C52E1|nr:uncharacterized protein LOC122411348 [Venturia canescens]